MDLFEQSVGHLVDPKKVERAVLVFQLDRALVITVNIAMYFGIAYLLLGSVLFSIIIAGVHACAVLYIWISMRFFPVGRHKFRLLPGMTQADLSEPRHREIALLWDKKCRVHGFRSAGVFHSKDCEYNFGINGLRGTAALALVIPCRKVLGRYIDAEIGAILEHEIAHMRLTGSFLRLYQYFACVPGNLMFSFCRMLRNIFLDMHCWSLARIAHQTERALFRLTLISVKQREEYAADALAGEASGVPYPLITVFAIDAHDNEQLNIDGDHGDDAESEFVFAVIERSVRQISVAQIVGQSYDMKFRSHPSNKLRKKYLLALRT